MRTFLLLLAVVAASVSAESAAASNAQGLEEVEFTDGRIAVGVYDPESARLVVQVNDGYASLRVDPERVVSRRTLSQAEVDERNARQSKSDRNSQILAPQWQAKNASNLAQRQIDAATQVAATEQGQQRQAAEDAERQAQYTVRLQEYLAQQREQARLQAVQLAAQQAALQRLAANTCSCRFSRVYSALNTAGEEIRDSSNCPVHGGGPTHLNHYGEANYRGVPRTEWTNGYLRADGAWVDGYWHGDPNAP